MATLSFFVNVAFLTYLCVALWMLYIQHCKRSVVTQNTVSYSGSPRCSIHLDELTVKGLHISTGDDLDQLPSSLSSAYRYMSEETQRNIVRAMRQQINSKPSEN